MIMTVNHVFSAFSFISFVVVSVPFAWHLKARNTATCLYISWVSISSLVYFVNSVVWDGNIVDWSPVWCDISGRIVLATKVAVPATCLCIQRRLYHFVLNPFVVSTKAQKRRLIMIDVMIGLGIPILNITLAYVVQIQRYEILGDFGCRIPLINTSLGVLLDPAVRLFISLIGGIYGCLNLYHVYIKRRTVNSMLNSSTGGLNASRYFRLLTLSGLDILMTIPYSMYGFTTWFPVYPWVGWTVIHFDFSRIDRFQPALWQGDHKIRLRLEGERWVIVVYAFIFFCCFGLTDEARRRYALALRFVAKKVGSSESSPSKPLSPESEHPNLQSDPMPLDNLAITVSHENQNFTFDAFDAFKSDGQSRSTVRPSTSFESESKLEFESGSISTPY